MLFNSIEFGIFLPIVFFFYWFIFSKRLKLRNVFLISVSYLFYGWWDWRFLSLIIISSIIDYNIGKLIEIFHGHRKRKLLLLLSVFSNLTILIYFKYANFFIENFAEAFQFLGMNFNVPSLNIILPVGISFYTFQTMSYTIDVYRNRLKAEKDWSSFFAFVGFFPQLVAGPIERAIHLLPQFNKIKKFNYSTARVGCQQALWGLFKKVAIADNAAIFVNQIFDNYQDFNGSTLVIGAVLFAFQIYGDFSGYSDMAIGISKVFGFRLNDNFKLPYFSRDIAEFWRRWHISLSSWFRDYVYIPLGGSQGSKNRTISNVFIIFLLSGFWHGANWTFIIWGGLNAIYFLPLLLLGVNRRNIDNFENILIPKLNDLILMFSTFCLTVFAWIFFRSESAESAFGFITGIFKVTLFSKPEIFPSSTLLLILFMIIIEWINRNKTTPLEFSEIKSRKPIRWSIYFLLVFLIFAYADSGQEFIYFRF